MPQLVPPSVLINCNDLASCFQALYNFLFTLLVALCLIWFVYGAFEYLFSGAGIFKKDAGKKKMTNSIIALIVTLLIPSFLWMINRNIFNITLQIPKVTAELPGINLEAVEQSEKNLTDGQISARLQRSNNPYTTRNKNQCWLEIGNRRIIRRECDVRVIFRSGELKNINFSNNDGGTEYINPELKPLILELDRRLQQEGIKIMITDGLSRGDHISRAHTLYGTAIDVVVRNGPNGFKLPTHPSWDRVIQIAKEIGFDVLDERYIKGSRYSTGAHLHLQTR